MEEPADWIITEIDEADHVCHRIVRGTSKNLEKRLIQMMVSRSKGLRFKEPVKVYSHDENGYPWYLKGFCGVKDLVITATKMEKIKKEDFL